MNWRPIRGWRKPLHERGMKAGRCHSDFSLVQDRHPASILSTRSCHLRLNHANEPNSNRSLFGCPEGVNGDGFGHVYAERTQFQDDMTERTLPTAVGVVNPDLKRKQPWALGMRSGRVAIVRAHGYTC